MAIDTSLIGSHASAHMDALEADYDDNWAVATVITVVELVGPDGSGHIRARSCPEEGPRTSQLIGVLESAKLMYADSQRRS